MSEKAFSKPVLVKLGGIINRISSAWEALELLSNHWPFEHCSLYRKAVATCRDALDGWATIEKARAVFVQAAHKAGLIAEADALNKSQAA